LYRCSLSATAHEIGYGPSKSFNRCVFLKVVIVSGACQICKTVLKTINSVVQTTSRILKKVACKYIINKIILDVKLLLFRIRTIIHHVMCLLEINPTYRTLKIQLGRSRRISPESRNPASRTARRLPADPRAAVAVRLSADRHDATRRGLGIGPPDLVESSLEPQLSTRTAAAGRLRCGNDTRHSGAICAAAVRPCGTIKEGLLCCFSEYENFRPSGGVGHEPGHSGSQAR
jgi:hypothetical protein